MVLLNCVYQYSIYKFCNRSYIRIVYSNQAGMGKSLYITRLAQDIAKRFKVSDPLVTIRVHGPKIAEERIMNKLQSLGTRSNVPLIVHFDIAPSVSFICTIIYT